MMNEKQDHGHPARTPDTGRSLRPGWPRSTAGFTLVEVLFAIAILGVGIVGILTLFVSGINMAGWAGSRSQASMEAQSLYAQILSLTDNANPPNHFYIEVMRNEFYPSSKWAGTGATSIWIHQCTVADPSKTTQRNPIPIALGHDYYWQCRVTNYMMDKKDPLLLKATTTETTEKATINPPGLVEVALGIYKQWKVGAAKEPLAVYTTLLSLESK